MPAATRPREDGSDDDEEAVLASPPPKIPRLALEYVRSESVVKRSLSIEQSHLSCVCEQSCKHFLYEHLQMPIAVRLVP